MSEVVAAVNRSDYANANRIATETAYEIMSNSRTLETVSDDAVEIVRAIASFPVSLNPKQKKETAFSFGSYGEFFRRNMGRIKIRNCNVTIDVRLKKNRKKRLSKFFIQSSVLQNKRLEVLSESDF